MAAAKNLHPAFQRDFYLFRRKVLKLFGGAFHVYDENGRVVLYSKQKAFKLREDFRVYSGEHKKDQILSIKTPQILDIGATYNVQDAVTGEPVGSVRRNFLKSMVRDEWIFLSSDGREIGRLTETSAIRALLSRFISLVPQVYAVVSADGRVNAEITQHFNPLVLKYAMTVAPEPSIDRRLLIAAGILLAGIERRQR